MIYVIMHKQRPDYEARNTAMKTNRRLKLNTHLS